jgi:hypothetical protein
MQEMLLPPNPKSLLSWTSAPERTALIETESASEVTTIATMMIGAVTVITGATIEAEPAVTSRFANGAARRLSSDTSAVATDCEQQQFASSSEERGCMQFDEPKSGDRREKGEISARRR